MMYLGDKPIGINDSMKIDWDAVASGGAPIGENIILSDFTTIVKKSAFSGLPVIRITGNGVTNLESQAFNSCTNLIEFDMPNIISYGGDSLRGCNKLTNVNFKKTQSFGQSAIRDTAIEYVVAPNLYSIGSDTFYNVRTLKGIDIGNQTINDFVANGYIFDQTASCITILRYGYVLPAVNGWFYVGCWLKNTTTPGTLYVWQDLIEEYQNHSVWGPLLSSNNNQILPIEGSIYENKYVDGTPIT